MFGYPKKMSVPFTELRNFVKKILENIPVEIFYAEFLEHFYRNSVKISDGIP